MKKPRAGKQLQRLSRVQLEKMVEEAIVDAHDEDEAIMGFMAMFEDLLALPFQTEVLGVPVTVEAIESTDRNEIVAVCRRGQKRQAIPILDLPLPFPPPKGAEWIEAYRHWLRNG